jgi:hypothetical protein
VAFFRRNWGVLVVKYYSVRLNLARVLKSVMQHGRYYYHLYLDRLHIMQQLERFSN